LDLFLSSINRPIAEEGATNLYVDEDKLEMRVQLEQKYTMSFFWYSELELHV